MMPKPEKVEFKFVEGKDRRDFEKNMNIALSEGWGVVGQIEHRDDIIFVPMIRETWPKPEEVQEGKNEK